MTTPPSANGVENRKHRVPLLLALIAAGLAGNFFKFPIFFNIDFLFGSIFAMLALQLFGLGRGILAAAIIASYTFSLWNHPYAIVIMTAEVAIVGLLMNRHKIGMVLADTLYWLIIGMPLVYLFYHVTMQVPFSNTYIAMSKQAVNGIANALAARLIYTGYELRSRSSLTSYSEIVYNLLAFFVLYPALILLAISSRFDFAETDLRIRTELIQNSLRETYRMENWVLNRKSAIINLAEMAASKSPQQMQPFLELAKKSDVNFMRIGLLDREATTTSFYPVIDELGQKNIGKSFAERPFIPLLKQTLKPMLSEVYQGSVGTPKPVVAMLAPIVTQGEYGGYVIGVLSLQQIKDYLLFLTKSTQKNAKFYTLLDKNRHIIMSNRADQKVMTPFVRGKGVLIHLGNGISQWVPTVPSNTPLSERWKESFYVAESDIGELAEWKLILEQPVAPFQKTLYDYYTDKLAILFLILLGALALAELFSRKVVVALGKLDAVTHELPVRMATDGNGFAWPESGIKEVHNLISNFKDMSDSLSAQFSEVRQINASLEQRVEERTNQLASTMQELNLILENAPISISRISERRPLWVNDMTERLFQYSKEELEFQTIRQLYPSDEAYEKLGKEAYPVLARGLAYETVQEMVKKDGTHILIRSVGKAIEPTDLSKGIIWLLEDITELKHAEDALRESDHRYSALFASKIDGIAHCRVITDENGRPVNYLIVRVNDAYARIVGIKKSDIEGHTVKEVFPGVETFGSDYIGVLGKIALEGGDTMFEALLETTRQYLSIYAYSPLPGEFTAIITDVTERRRTAEALAAKRLELEKLNSSLEERIVQAVHDMRDKDQLLMVQSRQAAMGEMIGNIAHQWRQPLNILGLIAQELQATYKHGKFSSEYLDATVKRTMEIIQQMSKTINDFRNFFQPDKQKVEFKMVELIEKTLSLLAGSFKTHGIRTELESTSDPSINGYPNEMAQVLLIIFNNAIDALLEHNVSSPTITIRLSGETDKTVVTISDNGGGIPEAIIDKVFDPYFTTKGPDKGTGIGLYMSKTIIENNMAGHLTVRNTGSGAEFRIEV